MVPGLGLAALVELEENQSPTATTKSTLRKIHDCMRLGITPVAAVRLLVTGAAAVESSGASGSGVCDVVCGVLDMVILLAFQMSFCVCPPTDSPYRHCGWSHRRHPGG